MKKTAIVTGGGRVQLPAVIGQADHLFLPGKHVLISTVKQFHENDLLW